MHFPCKCNANWTSRHISAGYKIRPDGKCKCRPGPPKPKRTAAILNANFSQLEYRLTNSKRVSYFCPPCFPYLMAAALSHAPIHSKTMSLKKTSTSRKIGWVNFKVYTHLLITHNWQTHLAFLHIPITTAVFNTALNMHAVKITFWMIAVVLTDLSYGNGFMFHLVWNLMATWISFDTTPTTFSHQNS